jgi:predicted nuclease of predicted toxin-antitoxin system
LDFLVDAQLPRRLALLLSAAGHPSIHVFEILPQSAIDREVAVAANSRMAILMSKDQDFAMLSARGILRVPLLWVRCGNMATPGLWRIIEPMLPAIGRSFASGEKIVEIR